MKDVRLRVWRIEAQSATNYLLWLLDDDQHPLPMSIGPCEAMAIEGALRANGGASRTAATHDLIRSLISHLGGKLAKVVIDDLWNGVYYAKLHLAVNGETLTVDSRPSDAIAIALRGEVPLYATDLVMAAANETENSQNQADSDFT
jgi:hypothetical protein